MMTLMWGLFVKLSCPCVVGFTFVQSFCVLQSPLSLLQEKQELKQITYTSQEALKKSPIMCSPSHLQNKQGKNPTNQWPTSISQSVNGRQRRWLTTLVAMACGRSAAWFLSPSRSRDIELFRLGIWVHLLFDLRFEVLFPFFFFFITNLLFFCFPPFTYLILGLSRTRMRLFDFLYFFIIPLACVLIFTNHSSKHVRFNEICSNMGGFLPSI